MEKVKLTQEQANAIELAKKRYGSNKFIFDFSRTLHEISPVKYTGKLDPINDLPLHSVARALYVGYEVEPKFKIGQYVTYDNGKTHGEKTSKIISFGYSHAWEEKCVYFDSRSRICMPISKIRHATKKEILWAEHNRDVLEFRKGDILIDEDNKFWTVRSQRRGRINFTERHAFIPTNIFYEFGWKVVCFAEDRKDIKHE